MVNKIKKELRNYSSKEKADILQRFFKTGKGEYGEGDIFIGVKVPEIRKTVKRYKDLQWKHVEELLSSKIHEQRLFALLVMVDQFSRADEKGKEHIFKRYIKNRKHINNWDLVDLTAPKIAGAWLFERDRSLLKELALSENLWDRRIAVLATFFFIRKGEFLETLKISKSLLSDEEDLIHKAVGWMLREVGKRDPAQEEKFLKTNYKKMPRTMLRYAIERFPEEKRAAYLTGTI